MFISKMSVNIICIIVVVVLNTEKKMNWGFWSSTEEGIEQITLYFGYFESILGFLGLYKSFK